MTILLLYVVKDNKLYQSLTGSNILNVNGIDIDPEYIEKGEFTICNTCTGFGDWAILSAMPRLLKKKYPNCKVYLPTRQWLLKTIEQTVNYSGLLHKWPNIYEIVEKVYINNPYVDGFKDDISGIVYTDHFRYVEDDEYYTPLAKQLLRFYKLTDEEIGPAYPEIYFSKEEIDLWNSKFNLDYAYGCLTLSNRWKEDTSIKRISAIKDILNFYKLPIIYFGEKPIEDTDFKEYVHINMLDITNDIRFQTYIRMNARFNVGNQTGVLEVLAQYSETFMTPHKDDNFKTYFINGIRYLNV